LLQEQKDERETALEQKLSSGTDYNWKHIVHCQVNVGQWQIHESIVIVGWQICKNGLEFFSLQKEV